MNRLRNRLIFVFIVATLLPVCLTLWTTLRLLELSRGLAPLAELDAVSRSLETTGRELYNTSRETLRRDAADGRVAPRKLRPADAQAFWDSGEAEQFELGGERGNQLEYFVRHENSKSSGDLKSGDAKSGGGEVWVYSRPMGVAMGDLTARYGEARQALDRASAWNVRRGFSTTLIVVASALWVAALGALIFLADRISRPVRELTQGLGRVAAGDLDARVGLVERAGGSDEIGAAMQAFNHMADQLQHSRERLIHVTRVASWQALARKMAHEVKNSLTPIRLTMEEILSRSAAQMGGEQTPFLEQAAQIVADEVQTLEKRVKAFSEFASEPPVMPAEIDLNALVEERIAFLKSSHPEVTYDLRLAPERPVAVADPDLIKGVLTNLLENAAQAAQPGGTVRAATGVAPSSGNGSKLSIEVHDSGPGLSAQARSTLFEPTISFKKGGMGLGLSIARRSALLCGGDIQAVEGELGGAGFRVVLSATNTQE
jgi:two-component system nitrogen regulation sensor histidine kinase NtrY